MKMPSSTNGDASPSFSAASAPRAKRGVLSPSVCSPGGSMPMSPASTGSVGVSTAPRMTAALSERPMASTPNRATAAMVRGMTSPIRMTTERHPCHVSLLSMPRPEVKTAMTRASSVVCSTRA
jgi:hypothetical protein